MSKLVMEIDVSDYSVNNCTWQEDCAKTLVNLANKLFKDKYENTSFTAYGASAAVGDAPCCTAKLQVGR